MKKPDSLLTLDDKEAIAYALYAAGFEPTTSTDFCNTIIRGYGNGNSYFEYQLVCDENNKVIPWEIVKAAQQRMQPFAPDQVAHKKQAQGAGFIGTLLYLRAGDPRAETIASRGCHYPAGRTAQKRFDPALGGIAVKNKTIHGP